MSPRYAELQATSHFSFLRGASSCEELLAQAALYGNEALAVTDRNSLAGVVRAHLAAKATGVRLVVGCRLDLEDALPVLVYPTDRAAYGRLCRLLTLGKARAGKGKCRLTFDDLSASSEDLIAVMIPHEADEDCALHLRRLRNAFPGRAYLALTLRRRPTDQLRLHELSNLAAQAGVATAATGDVLYHEPRRRILQDVLTCIRLGVTIDELGLRRERHADRHLKSAGEMRRLFARYPEALDRTLEITERCRFSLDELSYQYPEERDDPSLTPQLALEKLTFEGAAGRYPQGVPDKVRAALAHELRLIEKLNYAPYFLTVDAIVRFARSKGILCQGRGSAANSAVCYCLGITSIPPDQIDLLFERFVSEERREPPDIDVDFEHERREEVIQWIFVRYGRDHAALCATVIRYRVRGALRDVGKALGLPEDLIKALSTQVSGWSREGVEAKHAKDLNLNLADRRLRLTLELARELIGAPRHLSQHPGGFVLTHDRLDDLVPIEPAAMKDRQVIEWDKEDVEALSFMKVDVLALGMLTCLRRAFELLHEHKGEKLDLASIPQEDAATYAMIQKADTIGTFQIESRAQMSMLPRLKPKEFYDLVIEVAIVRPGPIQGDMVHPYLRRRENKEPVDYPTPALRNVLERTHGVPLFQEQAMRVAIDCAGFTPGEADLLRKSMATFKNKGEVSSFKGKLIEGMVKNGYERTFAERIFKQLEGFGSYGFPESHAASFALLAYASSWLKRWHPDVFCAALLNSQPMGFYAPAQIVRDAQEHGVEIRPICVCASRWDCMLEPVGEGRFAVRLGLRMARELSNAEAARLIAAQEKKPYASLDDLWRRSGLAPAVLTRLAEADAFRPAFGLSRREALWTIKGLRAKPLSLFAAADAGGAAPELAEPAVPLRPMPAGGEVVADYRHAGLSLRRHPLAFLRENLRRRGFFSCAGAARAKDGALVRTAGLVLLRQRPGSAKGVLFMTIEDETGLANLVIWSKAFEANRRTILTARMLGVAGRIQREGDVVHLVAQEFEDLSADLASVGAREHASPSPQGSSDKAFSASSPDPGGIYVRDLPVDAIRVKMRDFR